MIFSPLIEQLVEAFRCLPGVGVKSAQRMALHLLQRDRAGGRQLAETLVQAMDGVGNCEICRTLSEQKQCQICANSARDHTLLCIVESPADVFAIEQTASYKGVYFVLMGHLSPIDGVGPDQIGIDQLLQLLKVQQSVREVILATNPTVEGEATAHYIAEQIREFGIKVSRIAHGVPVGGELEFVDGTTLMHAFSGRKAIEFYE